MRTWLIKDALKRVWAKPNADKQMVVKLSPASAPRRHRIVVPIEGRFLDLPDRSNLFHVFDLGNFHPHGELNIGYHEGWVSLETLVNRTGGSFFFYDLNGVVFPTKIVYLKRMISDRFIVAIEQHESVSTSINLYCKLYDHAVKDDHTNSFNGVHIKSFKPIDVFGVNTAITTYLSDKQTNPFVTCRVNGRVVDTPDTNNVKVGDFVEIYSDDTIIAKHSFRIADLPTFRSTLDECKKYIIHIPKENSNGFNYRDDIEFWVREKGKSHYFYRHTRASLTQLTHNDYAIACNELNQYASIFDGWEDVEIDLVIRESGDSKEMVFNDNRIHELYRLTDDQIINAMSGINAHLDFWTAAKLEVSPVNYLRSNPASLVTHELVSDAYGYNAASFYAANTPELVGESLADKSIELAPLYSKDSTVYEYDAEGKLLGWWYHLDGLYTCRNNNTRYVEAISGRAGKELDVNYDVVDKVVPRHHSFRYYLEKLDGGGVPTGDYTDVTDDTNVVWKDEGEILRWNFDDKRYRALAIGDTKHLVKKEMVPSDEGVIRVSLTYDEGDIKGILLPFMFATVEVFLNSRPIVYGVDYKIDWPAITVTNKTYLIPDSEQEVIVRARVPASEYSPPKTGFVVNGVLSENTRYDIKDDKVIRISLGGGIKHRSEVTFREDAKVVVPSELNGLPYSIDSVAMPLNDLLEGGYQHRREEAIERDRKVEDYMSIHYPSDYLKDEQPLSYRYPVYSPVFNKMINDYENGDLRLVEDDDIQKISTEQVDMLMSHYEYLLESDPAYTGVNEWFVSVEPHWYTGAKAVEPLLFTFLDRINTRYFEGRVRLAHFLIIKET